MILVVCVEGLSASIRSEQSTLSYLVCNEIVLFNRRYPSEPVIMREVNSSGDVDRDIIGFLIDDSWAGKGGIGLMLVGKSYGAVKVWSFLEEYWSWIRDYKKIYTLLIDAHGVSFNDNQFGPYGKRKSLGFNKKWKVDHLKAVNIYQQYKYPYGARWDGAVNTEYPIGADHWSITDIESEYSEFTRRKVRQGLEWLS